MAEILTLPYLVDPHVHFRTPDQTHKEDFNSGSRAALAGGVTMVLDMPNNATPITTLELVKQKQELAQRTSLCDIGFYLGTLGEEDQDFTGVVDLVYGLKIYMNETTGKYIVSDPKKLESIFRRWDFPKPILVHAEGDTLKTAITLAEEYDRRLHVCHVSLAHEVDLIDIAKSKRPEMVTAEVTPHHLFKSRHLSAHPFSQMKPPLSEYLDMHELWEALKDGTIDIVATDHAPHTRSEKLSSEPPSGVTGLETMLPLLLMAERVGEISLDKIIEVTHTNALRIFDLPEQPDTFIEVTRNSNWEIRGSALQTSSQLTPFEGEMMMDRVTKVTLRGQLVYEDGNFLTQPGSGKVLPLN
jgi:dihydroorotase-like cyclic amidohydrolase